MDVFASAQSQSGVYITLCASDAIAFIIMNEMSAQQARRKKSIQCIIVRARVCDQTTIVSNHLAHPIDKTLE